ncbi:hypothetical protein ACWGB8_01695 [Kitasatospora sp. NPDC054939]
MNSELISAAIGAAGGLVGGLVAGSFALGAARVQARRAVEAALATARSTYLAPMDVAQRTAQRQVYERFLNAAQDFAAAAARIAVPAEELDQAAVNAFERRQVLNSEWADPLRAQLFIDTIDLRHAAQHVAIEGPAPIVTASRAMLQLAEEFVRTSARAGHVDDDESGVPDPPEPFRHRRLAGRLESQVEAFPAVASQALNSRTAGGEAVLAGQVVGQRRNS